jgi:spermidine synthase
MKSLFSHAAYAQVHVPSYPAGNIGILVCSDAQDPKKPIQSPSLEVQQQLKYYSPEMHKASFVLPS